MNHDLPRIWETIISKKAEQDIELLALTASTSSSGAKVRYTCRYKGVLLPLVKDFDTAVVLYKYLTGMEDLSDHIV